MTFPKTRPQGLCRLSQMEQRQPKDMQSRFGSSLQKEANQPFPATYYLLELFVLEFLSPYEEIEDRHVLVWCCSPIESSFLCHPVQNADKAQLRGQLCHNHLLPSRGVPCKCRKDRG